ARILATEEAENDNSEEEPEFSIRRSEEPEELRNNNQMLTYDMVLRSAKAKTEEKCLEKVKQWLNNMKRPVSMDDKEYSKCMMAWDIEVSLPHAWLYWKGFGGPKLQPT
ncbi:hypothetical protein C0995_005206, partial [Termitomyces sp. Mi166